MFNVYINNFNRNNAVVNTEELMFTVPSSGAFPVINPTVQCSEDSAESFSFTMESNSPYYDAILPLKTMFRIEYDGTTVFYGRAMAPSTSTVYHTKNVTCEGWFAFLNDTYYEGVQEKFRNKISLSTYLDRLISNHNSLAPGKEITRGTVSSGLMPQEDDKYEPTSWTQTSSLISNISSNYGGHMHIRYSGNTKYLDWYKYYAHDAGDGLRPSVRIGRNILDISSESDVDNIFTRVVPIGDTDTDGKSVYIQGYNGYQYKYMSVPYIRNLYTDNELTDEFHDYKEYRDAETNYGVIYKTMTFADADTQAKLWNYVKKWIKDSYFGVATSFNVKAIDFHLTGQNVPKILLGECVDVQFKIVQNGIENWVNKKLVCKSARYDLFNPENNNYVFGIPSDLLEYKKHNKKSSKKSTASAAAAAPSRSFGGGGEDTELTWYKVYQLIGTRNGNQAYEGTAAARSFYSFGELSGVIEAYDPEEYSSKLPHYTPNPDDPWSHDDGETPTPKQLGVTFKANLIGKFSTGGTMKYVALSGDRGLFAYTSGADPHPVAYWYIKKKGYTYEPSEQTISNFEKIALMIEQDGDSTYGGQTNANTFRNNKEVHATSKVYDPDKADDTPTIPTDLIHTVNVVGWFGSIYVGTSTDLGVFAFTKTGSPPYQIRHWYQKAGGLKYDTLAGGISKEDGGVDYSDDGLPGSTPTIRLIPGPVGGGINGGMQLGYDTTGSGDNWRVEMGIPIRYTDSTGTDQWAYGSVKASDFVLPTKESFKTKLIVTDALIAGVVQAVETHTNKLTAVEAYINNLQSNTIVANTQVSSAVIRGSTIRGDDVIINVTGSQQNPGGGFSLRNCYAACSPVEDAQTGTITLKFTRADGSIDDTPNFNIADTTTYRNGVLSARNNVKVNPFTANVPSMGQLTNSRTFTYTTDAPTPVQGTSQVDTWTLTGGNNWDANNKTTVYLTSSGGTNYAKLEVDASSIAGGAPTDWQLNYDSGNYNYKLKAKVGGTWYESGIKTAPNAYDNGWTGAYGTVEISPSTAQTLNPGGSVTVKALAKATSGAPSKTTVGSITVSAASVSVDDWQLNYDSGNYNYKLKAKVNGTWYESGIKTAPNAYDNGWTGAYGSVGISPSTAQTLNPGGSVTINAYAKATSGAPSTTNVASVVVTANTDSNLVAANIKNGVTIFGVTGTYTASASHTVTDFDTTSPAGASSNGYTNNSDGYYKSGSTAVIVVKGTWKCDGVSKSAYSYLKSGPTALMQNLSWSYSSTTSSGSSKPGGGAKTYNCSAGNKYHWFNVTVNGVSKRIIINIMSS